MSRTFFRRPIDFPTRDGCQGLKYNTAAFNSSLTRTYRELFLSLYCTNFLFQKSLPSASMSAINLPKKYDDTGYQAAHDDTYAHPLNPKPVERVLPPGVDRRAFDLALEECARSLGQGSALYVGNDLKDYVDPYELPEEGHEKRIPGAAIW